MRNDTEIPTRGRGRPRKFDENQVLRSAMERFRAHGFSNTSLDDLAEATGVNRPSLYAAFGDKKALYLAGLARTHANVDAIFAQLHAAAYPPEKMLKALFLGSLEGFLTGEDGPAGCIAVNTAATEAVTDPDIRAALAAFVALQDGWIERLMEQAADAAALRLDPKIADVITRLLAVSGTAEQALVEIRALTRDAGIVKGFAIGRTIFNDTAEKWLAGAIDDEAAIDDMAGRFARLTAAWKRARA